MSMRGLLEKLVKPPYEPLKPRGWMFVVLMLVFFFLCSLYAVRTWDSTAGLYVFFVSGTTLVGLMGVTIWDIMKSALKSLPQGIQWSRNSIESAWNRSKETMRRIAIWILAYLFVILLGEGLRWRDQTILAMVVLATICLLLLPTIWPKKKTERVEKEEIGKEQPHSHCWHVLAYGPKQQITDMFCCWCDTHIKSSPSNFHHGLIPVKPRYEEEA